MLKGNDSLGMKNFLAAVVKHSLGQCFPSVSLILSITGVTCEICTFLDPTLDLETQKLPWSSLGICIRYSNLVNWYDQGNLRNTTLRDLF